LRTPLAPIAALVWVLAGCGYIHRFETVTVTLAEPDGRPVPGVQVRAVPGAHQINYPGVAVAVTDQNGSARMRVSVDTINSYGFSRVVHGVRSAADLERVAGFRGRFRGAEAFDVWAPTSLRVTASRPYTINVVLHRPWQELVEAYDAKVREMYDR
jgi:hypothetical protein